MYIVIYELIKIK